MKRHDWIRNLRIAPTSPLGLPTAVFRFPTPGCRLPVFLCLLLTAFCLLPAAFCQQAPAAPAGQEPPSRIAPSAQELFDRTIQALGGDAFLHAKSLKTRGRLFAIEEGSTAGLAPFESTVEFPDKRRLSYGKGTTPVILVNNGDAGFQLDRYGMVRQPADQVQRWKISTRYSLENLFRQIIREPGILVQDAGRDFVDNLPARVVDIIDRQHVHMRLYVNAKTLLPIRFTYRVQDPKTAEWDEFAEVYGEYKMFQGVQTPMQITRLRNGERYSEIFRAAAEYNAAYPANYFEPVR
ncbi:MAG: hypothetical protein ACE145_03490 [Terriglobia bacterium]